MTDIFRYIPSAPRQSSLDGKIVWEQGSGVFDLDTSSIAVKSVDDGGEVGDIQRAVDKAENQGGGTVFIRNGTYIEEDDITLPDNISLVGESFGGVNIVFAGAFSIKATGLGLYTTGTVSTTKNSTTVTGSGTTWLSNLTDDHSIVINSAIYGIASVDSDTEITLESPYSAISDTGLAYRSAIYRQRIQLNNLVVISLAAEAINFELVTVALIERCIVSQTAGASGVLINNSAQIVCEILIIDSCVVGLTISNSESIDGDKVLISNCSSDGFQFINAVGGIFTSMLSDANGGRGGLVENSLIDFSHCSNNNNVSDGLELLDSTSLTVFASGYSENGGSGIKLDGTDKTNLSNLFCDDNAEDGIELVDSDDNIMIGNTCSNNTDNGVSLDATSDDNFITSNVFDANGTDIDDNGTNTVIIQSAGAVDSVNGQTGVVVLDQDDVLDGTTYKQYSDTEKTKLAGIEAGADVTDATNVDAAGATMNADTTLAGNGYFLDEDDMASNSATKVSSQQSIKAYVDAQAGGGTVDSVVAGNNIDVDATDPANPIVAVETLTPADIGLAATVTELDYVNGVTSSIQTQMNSKAADADVVHDTGNETVAGIKTFSSDPIIPDEAYDATAWDGSLEPPTKNAVRDKIETMGGGGDVVGPASVTDDNPAIFDGTTGKLIKQKTYAAFKTLLALVKGDVGLGNVDNTSDATKNAAAVILTNKEINASQLVDASVVSPKVADGFVVQVVAQNFNAVATTTTVLPFDDSIPQNTEGGEFMTITITPKSATNILIIEAKALVAIGTTTTAASGALFQDSTAGAIAADAAFIDTAANNRTLNIRHRMVAGTTSATTFKFRAGPNAAATLTFNGRSSARLFGDITKSSMIITEYKAP